MSVLHISPPSYRYDLIVGYLMHLYLLSYGFPLLCAPLLFVWTTFRFASTRRRRVFFPVVKQHFLVPCGHMFLLQHSAVFDHSTC